METYQEIRMNSMLFINASSTTEAAEMEVRHE
jgi:hypothetical protein